MSEGERAVSEVISFVLVFSLIAVTVGVVYVGGMGSLQNAQQHERIQNAERAFDVLDDNLADIYRHGAPSRATEVKLGGATIYLGDPVQLNVTSTNATATQGPYSVRLRPIVYESGEDSIYYESGSVIRSGPSGAVMNSEPDLLFDSGRTVFPYVQTRVAEDSSVSKGGDSTVLIRAIRAESAVLGLAEDGPYTVTFNVTSSHPQVWESHLESELAAEFGGSDYCSAVGATVTCEFQTDSYYVSVTRVDVVLA